MKFLNSNTVFFRKNKLTMAFIFALGSVSLLACTPDNEVTGSLDQNEFIDRVSERGVFDDWDVNDDNQLSEDEWSQHDEYNLIYESWDQDGDGQLCRPQERTRFGCQSQSCGTVEVQHLADHHSQQ